jgi:hypothetical protein
MVVVYLRNGEKAPMPDANFVKVEASAESGGESMLRCFFGSTEVGQFKWGEVAGYTVEAVRVPDAPIGSYDAWTKRIQ